MFSHRNYCIDVEANLGIDGRGKLGLLRFYFWLYIHKFRTKKKKM